MPDFPVKNQYRGINAHLRFWQAEGKWNRFHNPFMTYLFQQVQHLLMSIDYISHMEYSIQLRRVDDSIYAPQDNPLSDKYYSSLVIYRFRDEQKPVVWIELLSPVNKCPGEDREIYLQRREALLNEGIGFIELDFVNDVPPDAAGKHPYHILVFKLDFAHQAA